MVEPLFDSLKAAVRRHRQFNPSLPLSYATHLEIAVRLATGAPSINHFKARQDEYPYVPIPRIGETLSALRACESLVESAPVEPLTFGEPDDYLRYERWQLLAEIWFSLVEPPIDRYEEPRPLQQLLCLTADIGQMNIPRMMEDGQMLSPFESALRAPDEGWILSAWLFEMEGLGIDHWNRLQSAAKGFGYGDEASHYYRAACRESVNHSWHPASAISLGVYDLPVSTPNFFQSGESDEDFRARVERIWRFEEPSAFE